MTNSQPISCFAVWNINFRRISVPYIICLQVVPRLFVPSSTTVSLRSSSPRLSSLTDIYLSPLFFISHLDESSCRLQNATTLTSGFRPITRTSLPFSPPRSSSASCKVSCSQRPIDTSRILRRRGMALRFESLWAASCFWSCKHVRPRLATLISCRAHTGVAVAKFYYIAIEHVFWVRILHRSCALLTIRRENIGYARQTRGRLN